LPCIVLLMLNLIHVHNDGSGTKPRGCRRKTWWYGVKDIIIFGLS